MTNHTQMSRFALVSLCTVLGLAAVQPGYGSVDYIGQQSPFVRGDVAAVHFFDIDKDGVKDMVVAPGQSLVDYYWDKSNAYANPITRHGGLQVYLGKVSGGQWKISPFNVSLPLPFNRDPKDSPVASVMIPELQGLGGPFVDLMAQEFQIFQVGGARFELTSVENVEDQLFVTSGPIYALAEEWAQSFRDNTTTDFNNFREGEEFRLLLKQDDTFDYVGTHAPDNTQDPLLPGAFYSGVTGLFGFNCPGILSPLPPARISSYRFTITFRGPSWQVASTLAGNSIHQSEDTTQEIGVNLGTFGPEFGMKVSYFNGENPYPFITFDTWSAHLPHGPYENPGIYIQDFSWGDVRNTGYQDIVAATNHGIRLYKQSGPKVTRVGSSGGVGPLPGTCPEFGFLDKLYLDTTRVYTGREIARTGNWGFAVTQALEHPVRDSLAGCGVLPNGMPFMNLINTAFTGYSMNFPLAGTVHAVDRFRLYFRDQLYGDHGNTFYSSIEPRLNPYSTDRNETIVFDGLDVVRNNARFGYGVQNLNFMSNIPLGQNPAAPGLNDVYYPDEPFTSVKVVDLDRDGWQDLIAISRLRGSVVLRQVPQADRKTAEFVETTQLPGPNRPYDNFVMADMDQDGFPDFVGVSTLGASTGVQVFLNTVPSYSDRTIGWTTDVGPRGTATRHKYHDVVAADMDKDGDLDLVAARVGGGIDVYINNFDPATRSFNWSIIATASTPFANSGNYGDGFIGKVEVVGREPILERWTVRCIDTPENNPALTAAQFVIQSNINPGSPSPVYSQTLSENQLFYDETWGFTFKIFPGERAFRINDGFSFWTSSGPQTLTEFKKVSVADYDRDGRGLNDIFASGDHGTEMWLRTGERSWSPGDIPTQNSRKVLAVSHPVDFTGDSTPDLAIAEEGSGVQLFGIKGQNSPTFIGYRRLETGITTKATKMQVANMDLDNIPDLVAGTPDDSLSLQYFRGNGQGEFRGPFPVPFADPLFAGVKEWSDFVLVDLDGDRKLDLVGSPKQDRTGSPRVGTGLYIFLRDANDRFQLKTEIDRDGVFRKVIVQDLNRDGIPDIVAANALTGFAVYIGQGDGTFTSDQARSCNKVDEFGFPIGTNSVTVADVNLDGWPDIIAGSDTQRGIWVYQQFTKAEHQTLREHVAAELSVIDEDLHLYAPLVYEHENGCSLCAGLFTCFVLVDSYVFSDSFNINTIYDLVSKDLNGDTIPDLLVSTNNGVVSFNGMGSIRYSTFSGETRYLTGNSRRLIVANLSDILFPSALGATLDGGLTFFDSSYLVMDNSVRMLNVAFGSSVLAGEEFSGTEIAIGDFTSDGVPDLAVSRHLPEPAGIDIYIGDPDTDYPTVTGTDPQDEEVVKPITESFSITITFSENMDTSSINPDSVRVEQFGLQVLGIFYSTSPREVTFIPLEPLRLSTESPIRVTVKGGKRNDFAVRDFYGKPLDGNADGTIDEVDNYIFTINPSVLDTISANIVAAGLLDSDLSSDTNRKVKALAFVRSPQGKSAIDRVTLMPDIAEQINLQDTGFTYGTAQYLYYVDIPAPDLTGPATNDVLFQPEIQAFLLDDPTRKNASMRWPYYEIPFTTPPPAPAPTTDIEREFAREVQVPRFQDLMEKFVSRREGMPKALNLAWEFNGRNEPIILAAGFADSTLNKNGGTLEILAFTADAQGSNTIERVDVYIEKFPWDAFYLGDLAKDNAVVVGGYPLGDYRDDQGGSIMTVWGRRFFARSAVPEGRYRIILTAYDRDGNMSTPWPYIQVRY